MRRTSTAREGYQQDDLRELMDAPEDRSFKRACLPGPVTSHCEIGHELAVCVVLVQGAWGESEAHRRIQAVGGETGFSGCAPHVGPPQASPLCSRRRMAPNGMPQRAGAPPHTLGRSQPGAAGWAAHGVLLRASPVLLLGLRARLPSPGENQACPASFLCAAEARNLLKWPAQTSSA